MTTIGIDAMALAVPSSYVELADLESVSDQICLLAEESMRRSVAAIPDGSYAAALDLDMVVVAEGDDGGRLHRSRHQQAHVLAADGFQHLADLAQNTVAELAVHLAGRGKDLQ